MNPIIIACLILITCACASCSVDRVAYIPVTIPGDEIHNVIQSLPDKDLKFDISGLSYYHDKIYAATNIGLIMIDNDRPVALYQWRNQDPVIEGPWRDYLNNEIWIWHIGSGIMTRYNGYRWLNSALPKPTNSIYTRGDILVGFQIFSTPKYSWMVGGGYAWRWESATMNWQLEPAPPAPKGSGIRAVVPLGKSIIYIIREDILDYIPSNYAIYYHERTWQRRPLSKMVFGGAVVANDAVFVRARDGTLLSANENSIVTVATPGSCEAIASTSSGGLLASFINKGIYLFREGEWEMKAPYPYDSSEGEHWAYLAEDNGAICYATSSVPHLLGSEDKFMYSGTTAIWSLRDNKLIRINLQ